MIFERIFLHKYQERYNQIILTPYFTNFVFLKEEKKRNFGDLNGPKICGFALLKKNETRFSAPPVFKD